MLRYKALMTYFDLWCKCGHYLCGHCKNNEPDLGSFLQGEGDDISSFLNG
jgi:hypothetical protein